MCVSLAPCSVLPVTSHYTTATMFMFFLLIALGVVYYRLHVGDPGTSLCVPSPPASLHVIVFEVALHRWSRVADWGRHWLVQGLRIRCTPLAFPPSSLRRLPTSSRRVIATRAFASRVSRCGASG